MDKGREKVIPSGTKTFALDFNIFVEKGRLLEHLRKKSRQLKDMTDELLAEKEKVMIVASEKRELEILLKKPKGQLLQGKINVKTIET